MIGNDAGELADCLCGDVDCRLWIEHGFFPTDAKLTPASPNALAEALRVSLAKRSVPTMDPVWSAAFNAALDMVEKDTAQALSSTPASDGDNLAWRLDRICEDCEQLTASDRGFLKEASAALRTSEARYLIRKGGAYYRKNSQGYTHHREAAGRYRLEEAIAITHPNGPNGPRDGMDYVLDTTTPTPDRFGEGYRAGVEASAKVAEDGFVTGPTDQMWEYGSKYTRQQMATAIRAIQPATGGEA